jgi:hypothetical protein
VPISCGKDNAPKFIFIGHEEGSEGGPTGDWAKTMIYPYADGKIGATAFDLKEDVSAPAFSCTDSFIAWAGKTSVKKLAIASGSIESVGSKFPKVLNASASVSPTPTGNLWILQTDSNKEGNNILYYANGTSDSLTTIGTFAERSLLGGNDGFVWLSGGTTFGSQSGATKTIRVDTAGKQSAELTGYGVAWATVFGDGQTLIVQPMEPPAGGFDAPYKTYTVAKDGKITETKTDNLPWRYLYTDTRISVLDSAHKKVWINEAGYGTFAIPLQ